MSISKSTIYHQLLSTSRLIKSIIIVGTFQVMHQKISSIAITIASTYFKTQMNHPNFKRKSLFLRNNIRTEKMRVSKNSNSPSSQDRAQTRITQASLSRPSIVVDVQTRHNKEPQMLVQAPASRS